MKTSARRFDETDRIAGSASDSVRGGIRMVLLGVVSFVGRSGECGRTPVAFEEHSGREPIWTARISC